MGLISIFIFLSSIVGPLLLFTRFVDHPTYVRLETISYESALPFLVLLILLYKGAYPKMTSEIKDKVRRSYFLPFFAFFFGIMASVSRARERTCEIIAYYIPTVLVRIGVCKLWKVKS